ncbi:GGDEF domain-containing protein [Nitratireductor sp. XY-223]|uniref:GGDEF domain-containing protein n=1 Tax=Nitratireductor sp. XY-223 TaxID=2561926 RepID=UPI00145A1F09|nr:GGDEF domain-containing protein [Nitratireductor sp. XY-223]
MAYPDLSFLSVVRKRTRSIVVRSLLLLVAIVFFAQGVNGYFYPELSGAERIANVLLCLKITVIVAVPFVIYVVLLQARADLAAEYFRLLSRTDALTGLLNRRAFVDLHTAVDVDESDQAINSRALLVIDLDHFKQVNDRFGHDAGDAILIQLADLFRVNLRPEDAVARMGGEEFAVALSRGTEHEALQVAQRLRHAVERNVFLYDRQEIRLTVSIGLVRYEGGEYFETALRQADLLTYKSKKDGRNRISCGEGQFDLPTAA